MPSDGRRTSDVTTLSGPWLPAMLLWLGVASLNVMIGLISAAPSEVPGSFGVAGCGAALSGLMILMVRRWVVPGSSPARALLGSSVVAAGSILWLIDTIRQIGFDHVVQQGLGRGALYVYRYNWVYFVLLFCLQAAVLAVWRQRQDLQDRERQIADIRIAVQQARLDALRLQLSPHFLFNTLNAVSVMTAEAGADEAREMIDRLAAFLRATLEAGADEMVSLPGELGTVEAYLDIEAVRLGERLRVHYAVEDGLDTVSVPALILQPLVENAIKHAVSPSPQATTIWIRAFRAGEQLVLEVENETADQSTTTDRVPEGRSAQPGSGLGLRNVSERLRTRFGREASLQASVTTRGFRARLYLPAQNSRL